MAARHGLCSRPRTSSTGRAVRPASIEARRAPARARRLQGAVRVAASGGPRCGPPRTTHKVRWPLVARDGRGRTRTTRAQRSFTEGGGAAKACGCGGPASQVHPASVAPVTLGAGRARMVAPSVPGSPAVRSARMGRTGSLRPISPGTYRQRGALARGAGRR
jgi:hypothetical protein